MDTFAQTQLDTFGNRVAKFVQHVVSSLKPRISWILSLFSWEDKKY